MAFMVRRAASILLVFAPLLTGCQSRVQPEPPVTAKSPPRAVKPVAQKSEVNPVIPAGVEALPPPSSWPAERKTLTALAEAARAHEFDLPVLDEAKIASTRIRKLVGKHIDIYTDLAAAADVEELPQVFDAAVPLWCAYFDVDPEKIADWKLIGAVMQQKEPFERAGLYLKSLPDFPSGYNVGSQLWLYEQPSAYYRRHLLLHEGTHAFMLRWLGGAGPPWYMEGMAELLGTHRWSGGKLTLGIVPRSKDDVPYWGRIKMIKDAYAAGEAMSLLDIMHYSPQAHVRVEAYAWCWAATTFLDQHPLTSSAFRELKQETRDRTLEFSEQFAERLREHWPVVNEDWQLFVADCDYGHDVPRAVVMRKPVSELPAGGGSATLLTDRGWQSTGYRLQSGKEYQIAAGGRYHIVGGPKPWPCEANGVTIRYVNGRPLGMLLAAVSDLESEQPTITPLISPQPIGAAGEITPASTGTLYLKINEHSSGLADNSGTLNISIREK
jgi:hypothetical protein